MTICPVHFIDLLIMEFEVVDLRLHRFEDCLNLLHNHILNHAFDIVFVFAEVHRCPLWLCDGVFFNTFAQRGIIHDVV